MRCTSLEGACVKTCTHDKAVTLKHGKSLWPQVTYRGDLSSVFLCSSWIREPQRWEGETHILRSLQVDTTNLKKRYDRKEGFEYCYTPKKDWNACVSWRISQLVIALIGEYSRCSVAVPVSWPLSLAQSTEPSLLLRCSCYLSLHSYLYLGEVWQLQTLREEGDWERRSRQM